MLLHLISPRVRLSFASTITARIHTSMTVAYCGSPQWRMLSLSRWAHTMCTGDKISRVPMTEEEAQLLAQLSEALLRDEAAALAVTPPGNICISSDSNDNGDEGTWMSQLSSQDYMELAMDPFPSQQEQPVLQDVSANNNNNNNNSGDKGHQELQWRNTHSSAEESSLFRAMRDVAQCRRPEEMSAVLSGALHAFMTSTASLANRAASELLLSGTDVKALLSDGTLRDLCIEQKCLSQCDFSTVSFLSVSATCVDFSRSLFYAAVFHNSVFVNCCFDGCVLKELRCSGNVRFEGCSFRFAHVVLRVSSLLASSKAAVGGATTGVVFDRCDFDLADFDGSDAIPQRCFVDCYNTHLASRFPPRANASS